MAKRDHKSAPSRGNPPIRARDQAGNEHFLVVVDHPAGMVSIADLEMCRILAPLEAISLITALSRALRMAGWPGSLSSTF